LHLHTTGEYEGPLLKMAEGNARDAAGAQYTFVKRCTFACMAERALPYFGMAYRRG